MSTPPTTARRRSASAVVSWALVVGSLALSSSSLAQAVPAGSTSTRTAAVVVRALAYHRHLRDRAGAHADLLVLTTPGRAAAQAEVFSKLASIAVQGLPLVVSTATPTTADELRVILRARHAEAVFVDELDPALHAVLRSVARADGIVVFSGRRDAIDSVAQVAIVDDGARARIVVSLPELRAARIEFAADLLKLAEVLR